MNKIIFFLFNKPEWKKSACVFKKLILKTSKKDVIG